MAYFANGSEGAVLDKQCEQCPLGEFACPILMVQQIYNYDQLEAGQDKLQQAMEMLVNREGICTLRRELILAGVVES